MERVSSSSTLAGTRRATVILTLIFGTATESYEKVKLINVINETWLYIELMRAILILRDLSRRSNLSSCPNSLYHISGLSAVKPPNYIYKQHCIGKL